MSSSLRRSRTLNPEAVEKAHQWREQRVASLQKRFDDNPLSLTSKERHELQRLGGRAKVGTMAVDPPKEELKTTAVKKELTASKISEVPTEVRRARALRRKAAVKPMIEERKRKQKKSRQDLKKAVMKPRSGHPSPRPSRHVSKRKGRKESTDA